jgi:hypothetical protein
MNALRTAAIAIAVGLAGQAQAVGSLADVNVFDRTEGKRLAVHWHQGRAYVVGKPGNEYQVTVRNRAGTDLLAVVSVDGVNAVSGETAEPGQSGYVLGAQRSYDIQGWRKSLSETAAFYFTSLADSYAARTGRPEDVGVIGVALFRRKAEPPAPAVNLGRGASSAAKREAADAASGAPAAEQAAPRLGTGHGRREASYVEHVAFERATLAPAETITLYYDSYRNLLARGIIREPVPVAPLPRPFPGFVPDPRG